MNNVFKLLKFIKGKALFFGIMSIVVVTVSSLFDVVQPIFLNLIVKYVSQIQVGDQTAWKGFWICIGLMASAAVLGLSFGVVGTFFGSKSSLLAAQYLRSGLYDKVLNFSFINIDKITTGSLITRITNDTQKFQAVTQMIFTILIRAPIMFVGGMIVGFIMNWILGLIVVCVCIAMVIIIGLIASHVIKNFELAQRSLDGTNTVMRENILGMRVIKSFGIQEEQTNRFRKINAKYKKYKIKAQSMLLPIISVVSTSLQVGMVIILLTGGIILSKNPDDNLAGQLFAFMQIMMMILGSTVMALLVIVNLIMSTASFKRINNVLNIQPSIKNPENPKNISEDFTIEFSNVNFKYAKSSKENVLKNLNFQIKSGETFGIIGSTGSGKSTIVGLIPRLYDTSTGQIKIGGIDVKELSIQDLREKISVVLQENVLFQGDIKENLKYGDQNANEEKLIKACKDACAWDFIQKFDKKLNYPVEQRGRNFSGGQKQRICIARALVKKPKIFILDDATNALDLLTEAKVQENLRKNYKNVTTIIVSQRVASIRNADRILVLDNGKISGIGSHSELIKSNSIYRVIVESQLGEGSVK